MVDLEHILGYLTTCAFLVLLVEDRDAQTMRYLFRRQGLDNLLSLECDLFWARGSDNGDLRSVSETVTINYCRVRYRASLPFKGRIAGSAFSAALDCGVGAFGL